MDLNRLIQKELHIKGKRGALPWMGWTKRFNRNDLAVLFNKAGFKVGAEIGVRLGRYSHVLCTAMPELKLYCVDPWVPFAGRRPTQDRQDQYFRRTQRRLKGFNVEYIRKPSLEATKDIPDGSLDFVYIDAMHDFNNVMMDIIAWVPKVRAGGIVSGHDYIKRDSQGICEAVDAYTKAHCIYPWYITGHNLADRTNSFFWVKNG